MRTLFLMRHAKAVAAVFGQNGQNDHDRPLVAKGVERTREVCGSLEKHGITPDTLLSSSAVRALQTANIVADWFHLSHEEILISHQLYSSSAMGYFDVLHQLSAPAHRVMVFAHNEAISAFANLFLPPQQSVSLRTSEVVQFDFDVSRWVELTHHSTPSCWQSFSC